MFSTVLTPATAKTPNIVFFTNMNTINVLSAPVNKRRSEFGLTLFTVTNTLKRACIPAVNILPLIVSIDKI